MEQIKKKFDGLKAELAEAQEREDEAKRLRKEAEKQNDVFELEIGDLRRKVILLETDLESAETRLATATTQLQSTEIKMEEFERANVQLTRRNDELEELLEQKDEEISKIRNELKETLSGLEDLWTYLLKTVLPLGLGHDL